MSTMTDKEAHKIEYLIKNKIPYDLDVEGKKYKVKQIHSKIRTKIHLMTMEAEYYTQQAKEPMSLRKAKKIQKKIYSLHAKTAACYLLNLWVLVPLVFPIAWRWMYLKSDVTLFTINSVGASNEGYSAFLGGWHLSRSLLEASMNPFGNAIKQKNERQVSAENMVVEDSQTKADSK